MNKICPILKAGTLMSGVESSDRGWYFRIYSGSYFCMKEDCMLWRNNDCSLIKVEDQ